ncbi:MAG TPA: diacylglycerol kinase family lipid kinase [Candidatus Marinimicrobia bacterium]|nr:diacylglycerol kinase family lipid kinase [Candidatus Neomarinimicrobiota bacterium]HRS51272.1 diacylglycerol kinase family lipid kinase [Candidatus Neomarinimicrobiota bacterium]HRU91490.1 diacylglycerol kinase family lipid kinase [Candidatus Neomarinimicrobiota bacterium]
MSYKFAVIVNPAAGKGRTIRNLPLLKEIAAKTKSRFDYFITEGSLHATRIADRIHREYDAVVAYGGDGTANEVMSGLAGTETPFGVIPEGTGNDFARCINVPRKFDKAIQILNEYKTRLMDLGTVGNRVFINGVGVGFDAYVNVKTKSLKMLKGSMAYLYSVLSSLAFWKSLPLEIEIDGCPISTDRSFLVAVGNGWACGGGLKLNPQANIHDSLFDVCLIPEMPVWKLFLNLRRLKDGTIAEVPGVLTMRCQTINICGEKPLPVHFDGEVFDADAREVDIKIVPQSALVVGAW